MKSHSRTLTELNMGNALAFAYATLAFLTLGPYFLWFAPPYAYQLISALTIATSIYYMLSRKKIERSVVLLVILGSLSVIIRQINSDGISVWINTMILLMLAFIIIGREIQLKSFRYFVNIYVVTLLPSLAYFLLMSVGFSFPWNALESTNEGKISAGFFYREYVGMVVIHQLVFPLGNGEIFRLSGFFDEPGVIGTVSALLIAAFWPNLGLFKRFVLVASGILSFSLTFFILMGVYFLFKKPALIISFAIVSALAITYLPDNIKENKLVSYYVMERLTKSVLSYSDVNNRTSVCFDIKYNDMITSENVWFGFGHGAHARTSCESAGSSYRTLIYNFGIMGFAFIVAFYLAIFFKLLYSLDDLYRAVPFIIVFLGAVYQRPAVDTLWLILIFIGFCLINNKRSRVVMQ